MKKYLGSGDRFNHTVTASISSGEGLLIGHLFGVALSDGAIDDLVAFVRSGIVEIAKLTSDDVSKGDKLYWDPGNTRVTLTNSGALKCVGVATADAGTSADTVEMVIIQPDDDNVFGDAQSAIADLSFGTDITAATADGTLTDSSATNPSDSEFNELAKELGTKVNDILAALRAAGVIET